MTQFTNTTRQSLSFPTKDGGTADARPGETVTADLDMDHAQVKAAIGSTIVLGKPKAAAAEPKNRAHKPD